MAAIGQPTNPTAPRPPVHGEVQEIEAQESSAPTGPEQRGRPANPPTFEVETGETPLAANTGSVGEVVPPKNGAFPQSMARPSTREEQISVALLGLGTLSTMGRRLAYALSGFPQERVQMEVPPRNMNPQAGMPQAGGARLPEESLPATAEETAQDQAVAEETT